jgi:hypothetical protein
MREYDIASGALVRVADADDRPSRTEMLLRFLRVAGSADAGACFEDATHAPGFPSALGGDARMAGARRRGARPRGSPRWPCDDPMPRCGPPRRMLPIVEQRLADARCPA